MVQTFLFQNILSHSLFYFSFLVLSMPQVIEQSLFLLTKKSERIDRSNWSSVKFTFKILERRSVKVPKFGTSIRIDVKITTFRHALSINCVIALCARDVFYDDCPSYICLEFSRLEIFMLAARSRMFGM